MKLYTDPGNFQTVKVLVAAELGGFKLEIQTVKSDEKIVPYFSNNKLPVLEVAPHKYIFSPNAAARLLLHHSGHKEDNQSLVDQWLDWECACLFPTIFPHLLSSIGHGKMDESLLQGTRNFLSHLDKELKGKQRLCGEQTTVADVAIWSTLYPVLVGKFAIKGWEGDYSAVSSWFSSLSSQPAFQQGITAVYGKTPDTKVLKVSLTSQPLPLQVKTTQQKPVVQTQTSKSKEESQAVSEKVIAAPDEIEAAKLAWDTGHRKCPKPLKREHPILPQEGKRNILITSALPYVNNVPHLGNIIGCVLSADVFSRYCRLRNYNCLYVCGTDEYGTATETKAIAEGVTPQQICDKYSAIHRQIYQWFNIDFDYFGRTSTEQQTVIAQDIFWKLYKRGLILKDSLEQQYCPKCDRFLADRFIEGTCPFCSFEDARGDQCDACQKLINAIELLQPKCKLCKGPPQVKTTQHLFLDLPKVEPELQKHLDVVFKTGTWTNNAQVITKSWIRDGLKPRCISRDLKWGIPVPLEGYTDKVFYVWYDAPIGYISITANYTDQWERWWKNPKTIDLYNFLGKDNVPFHSVIFPSSLLGADDNYTVVNHMCATEYLNYEDGKFSKSRGTGVFGDQARDTGIPADIYRFYLLYVRPESQDSSFSWDDFLLKNNSELLNNLGNFINRALMFVSNSFNSAIQEMILGKDDINLLALINRELHRYIDNMEEAKLRDSIRNILSISRLGNQFMQENKPWVLVKGTAAEKSRAGTVVSLAANIACLLSVLLQPYMPGVSATIQQQLNAPDTANIIYEDFVCRLPPGHTIGKPSPLFQKIETSTIADLKKKFDCHLSLVVRKPVFRVFDQPSPLFQKIETSTIADLKKKFAGSAQAPTSKPKQQNDKEKQPAGPAASPEEVQRLTDEVTKQGNVVRELKTNKADKPVVDTEVVKLLALKKQLALAQGQDPTPAAGGGGKKKGKKK